MISRISRLFDSPYLSICFIFVVSTCIYLFLYPDLFLTHTRHLLNSHETEIPLQSTYILASHFHQGGVQLWDRFDGISNAYFVLANGVYGVCNIIASWCYLILAPFFTDQGEGLYKTHLIVFYSLNSLVRIVGGYLLLRHLALSKMVIMISLIYLNTIFCSYMMTPGVLTQTVYSFLPMVIYFLLVFFDQPNLRRFLQLILLLSICFTSAPLFSLGYFYQVIHALVLILLAAFILNKGWRKHAQDKFHQLNQRRGNLIYLLVIVFIVMPYFWWGKILAEDIFIDGSGLSGTKGRFNNIFSLSGYFNVAGKSFANPLEFLGTSLDYHHLVWGASWVFIGATTFFFMFIALVFSKNRLKWIFFLAMLFILLLNIACYSNNFSALGQWLSLGLNPLKQMSVYHYLMQTGLYVLLLMSSLMHGINALTNPLSFLVRSFQMTALLIPFLCLPLMALGMQACWSMLKGDFKSVHAKRIVAGIFVFVLLGVVVALGGLKEVMVYQQSSRGALSLTPYVLGMTMIGALFLLSVQLKNNRLRWIGGMVLGVAFLLEIAMFTVYIKQAGINDQVLASRLHPLAYHEAIYAEYQNPLIMPLRSHMNLEKEFIYPAVNSEQGMFGAFLQFVPMGRYFRPWSIYAPRHLTLKLLNQDDEMMRFLNKNSQMLFLADVAFDDRYLNLEEIVSKNLENRVILVQSNTGNERDLIKQQQVFIKSKSLEKRQARFTFKQQEGERLRMPEGELVSFKLPGDFPSYFSTTVFSDDMSRSRLWVGNKNFLISQGKLTKPFTYDISNIKKDYLTVLLPKGSMLEEPINLEVEMFDGVKEIIKNTHDELAFIYEASSDGWLVLMFPYDKKWQVSIDGEWQQVSKANRYFMTTPIKQGKHVVKWQYWPHSPLRGLMSLSIGLSVVAFLTLIGLALSRRSY